MLVFKISWLLDFIESVTWDRILWYRVSHADLQDGLRILSDVVNGEWCGLVHFGFSYKRYTVEIEQWTNCKTYKGRIGRRKNFSRMGAELDILVRGITSQSHGISPETSSLSGPSLLFSLVISWVTILIRLVVFQSPLQITFNTIIFCLYGVFNHHHHRL